ncbi:hypothetical protein, partial [Dokdonella sp.]|uniref:hypothetical protein n=1 Tax=Dokdonella sp. TaxID=2291710 RepID=UPI003527BDED
PSRSMQFDRADADPQLTGLAVQQWTGHGSTGNRTSGSGCRPQAHSNPGGSPRSCPALSRDGFTGLGRETPASLSDRLPAFLHCKRLP